MSRQFLESYKMDIVDEVTVWAEHVIDDIDAKAQDDAERAVSNGEGLELASVHVLDDILPEGSADSFLDLFIEAYQTLYESYYAYYHKYGI